MKHAILLSLIEAARQAGPVRLIETHAGAGLYDLQGALASRSREAEAGVGRLMAATDLPRPLEALKTAVARENPGGDPRLYPGSPVVALGALGPGGRYLGCELRPDDFASLKAVLASKRDTSVGELHSLHSKSTVQRVRALHTDGYLALASEVGAGDLVLIDPPYERGDDYDRVVEAAGLCIGRGAGCAVWAPIKDLETLDSLIRRIEALGPRRLSLAEVRLHPLVNPMSMNGCAVVVIDTPDVDVLAGEICNWVARYCGAPEAQGGARRLLG